MKKQYATSKFTRGYCGEFAVALHRIFGYPLGMYVGRNQDDIEDGTFYMIHVFAFHPSGKLVDVRGKRTRAEVRKNLIRDDPADRIGIERTDPKDLDAISGEGLDEGIIEEGVQWILRHRAQYK